MSQDYSPSLVTKNLVFCGDAAMKSAAGPATLLYDKVNNNNGTMYNGACLNFDGTDDYVTVGGSGMNASTTAITTSMWIRFDGISDSWILANLSIADYTKGYLVRVDTPSNTLGFYVGTGSSSNSVWSTNTLSTSTWYHIVCTYKSGEQLIYVNGVVWASGAGTGSIDYTGITTGYIGVASDLSRDFDGQIANLMIYDTVLSAANVKELYDDSKVIIPTKNDASGGFVAQTNLKCWLSMGEGAGEYVYDGSGNGSYGTIVNGSTNKWLTGQTGAPQLVEGYNRPMLFDGSSDYVDCGASNALVTGTTLSVSAWVLNSGSANRGRIFQAQKAAGSTVYSLLVNDNAGTIAAGFLTALTWNGSSHNYLSFDVSCDDSQWHHVAMVITASSQKIYFDGVLKNTGSAVFSNIVSSDEAGIGSLDVGASQFFDGLINEVVLYDSELSLAQVQALAATGPNGGPLPPDPMSLSNSSNVVGYWRNDSNVTWTDRAGSANGTVNGSPSALLFKQGINGSKNVHTGRDNQGFPLLYQNNGAIGFDGVKDYVNITPALDWNDFPSVTVSMWIQTDFTGAQNYAFLSWANASNSGGLNMSVNSSGYFYVSYRDDAWSTGSYPTLTSTTSTVNDKKWHQCVFTYGTDPTIYVDGVVNGTASRNSAMTNISSELTYIGHLANHAVGNYHFDGRVANLQIYNRALTYAEIQQNYNSFKARFGK